MIAGVDGAKNGWVAVVADDDLGNVRAVFLKGLSQLPRDLKVAAVDVPIGLPRKHDREADRLARRALGRPRGSSVFATPVRSVLGASSWETACEIHFATDGRKLSRQAFNILSKIAEADQLIREGDEWFKRTLYEVHPELCFAKWAGRPMTCNKKRFAGRAERQQLIAATFGPQTFSQMLGHLRDTPVQQDDLADAFAALWSAARILARGADKFPLEDLRDAEEIPMRIWA